DVDPPLTRLSHARAEPLEVRVVPLLEVELRIAVERHARTAAGVRVRADEPVGGVLPLAVGPGRPARLLPGPEADDVVVPLDQEVEIALKIEGLRRVLRPLVLEVRPGVRAGQVDRPATPVGEVTRVPRVDPEWPHRIASLLCPGLHRGERKPAQGADEDRTPRDRPDPDHRCSSSPPVPMSP